MDVLGLNPDELTELAARDFERSLCGMRIIKLVNWEKIGLEEPERLDADFMKSLTYDKRRSVLDQVHDIAMLPIYRKDKAEERADSLAMIDDGVLDAKWRYMLSLANGAYDLGLDYVDLEILKPLYRNLATIERGATNVRMPTTHKLRHNPSIHSLHVAGLMHDVFTKAENGLPKDQKNELKSFAKAQMRSALVHDMGELEGELSVAEDRASMSAEEIKQFEEQRGHSEAQVFTDALQARKEELKRLRWPAALLEDKCGSWQEAYDRGEAADKFEGRVHKVMERTQSQQDYLRFNGRDNAPRLSAKLEGFEEYRDFMRSYVLNPLNGSSKGGKVDASLTELAGNYGSPEIADIVLRAVKATVTSLQKEIEAALTEEPQQEQSRGFTDRLRAEASSRNIAFSR